MLDGGVRPLNTLTLMSTVAEDLPSILPELRGDLIWQHIINDERPRPALSSLGDQIEASFKSSPDQFPKIKDSDFEKRA